MLCNERFALSTLPVVIGRLYRLRKVYNHYRSGYVWLRVRLCRLVYTQVCEHWLCASYARLHDPTLSSPIDHEVGYAWLCSERFAHSTLPLVMVSYCGYAKYITGTGLVTRRLRAWLCHLVYTNVRRALVMLKLRTVT